MESEKIKRIIGIAEDNMMKIKRGDFRVYFYILDTKGNPSSALEYIYRMAYLLDKRGYNVAMLHQEKDFVGVGGWLGDEYASLSHMNIEKENVEISPCDFLFIPEVFSNVMIQTKNLKCKKVVLVSNYVHLADFMPVSVSFGDLGIFDAITNTETSARKIREYFPELNVRVVPPAINPVFRSGEGPRKMVVNIISRKQENINRIVKPFYWQYPQYKWVSFRDLRGMSMNDFADTLRDAAITVWIDDDTSFGHTLLESLRSGGITVAKVPDHPVDWMIDNGKLTDRILWFDDIEKLPDIISSLVRSWTLDSIPEEMYEEEASFDTLYSTDNQEKAVDDVYVGGLFKERYENFEKMKEEAENNLKKIAGA